jgi:hypothetical protein
MFFFPLFFLSLFFVYFDYRRSTTSNIHVAAQYGLCLEGSLMFKITVPNAMMIGADLQWCSAFPAESEVLYPPLTYLTPSGKIQELVSEINGAKVTVVEVTPDLSSG